MEEFTKAILKESKRAQDRPEYKHTGNELSFVYRGVYFNCDVKAKKVEIVEMFVPLNLREKGKGSAALDWFVGICKQFQLRVVAIPENFGYGFLNNEQLSEWYVKHGVKIN